MMVVMMMMIMILMMMIMMMMVMTYPCSKLFIGGFAVPIVPCLNTKQVCSTKFEVITTQTLVLKCDQKRPEVRKFMS